MKIQHTATFQTRRNTLQQIKFPEHISTVTGFLKEPVTCNRLFWEACSGKSLLHSNRETRRNTQKHAPKLGKKSKLSFFSQISIGYLRHRKSSEKAPGSQNQECRVPWNQVACQYAFKYPCQKHPALAITALVASIHPKGPPKLQSIVDRIHSLWQ